ncbi:Heterokaryon incompatibility protein (HET) domain containing protein [Rhypophila decipiens]
MPISDLCSFCANINFDALRNPLLSDLPAIRDGTVDTSRHPFKGKTEDAHASTQLGKLSDIAQRAESCRLCALMIKSLARHNGRRPQPDDVCRAETSFYGVYRTPSGHLYWTGRTLTIGIRTPQGSWAHAFQACNVGALSMDVDVQNRFQHKKPIDSMIFGGRRRPLSLDLNWVRQWIKICKTDHGDECETADVDGGSKTTTIRFVDVVSRCVVTLDDISLADHEYMALSYVWGGPQKVSIVRANKKALSNPGSLPTGHLPQTLEDAMHLARSLGFRHLWIDALCIVQDDLADKQVQIGQMSLIYGFSSLTVIAATAKTADGGLPGIREGTRSLEQDEIVIHPEPAPGTETTAPAALSLMTTLYPLFNQNDHYLEHTSWNDRGWTMQERVMSRRVLVFMPEQVHWICREATFCEESYFENETLRFHRFHAAAMEPTLRRKFRNFFEPEDEELRLWTTYNNLVSRYTRRQFTYPGDVFDGFLCILEGMTALAGQEFLWGMPRSHFEQSILWTSFRGSTRRTELSTLPMTSLQVRITFPSWSWMGWIGEASILIGDDRLDEEIGETPEVVCFEHCHNPSRLQPVSPAASRFKSLLTSAPLPRWKQSHNHSVTMSALETNMPQLYTSLPAVPEGLLIFFWTSMASFTLVPTVIPPAFTDGQAQVTAEVMDAEGQKVGTVGTTSLDDEVAHRQGVHKFIVVGSRRNPFSDPVLLVLQVVWREGIAYRMNSGEILEAAWERASPAWTLVVLG